MYPSNMEVSIRPGEFSIMPRLCEIGTFSAWTDGVLGTTVLGFSNIRLKTGRNCGRVQDKPSCPRMFLLPGFLRRRWDSRCRLHVFSLKQCERRGGAAEVLPHNARAIYSLSRGKDVTPV